MKLQRTIIVLLISMRVPHLVLGQSWFPGGSVDQTDFKLQRGKRCNMCELKCRLCTVLYIAFMTAFAILICIFSWIKVFYASAFRRRRHYVFRLSVRPSVHPSEAWNTLFWHVHGSVGPPDQLWPFCGMSVRPSVRLSIRPTGEVSGHLPENT